MDILHPVKAEPVDVPLYTQGVADVEDTSSRKKRKLIVMVVVPTLKEVDRMRRAELGYKEETKVFQHISTKKIESTKIKKNPMEFNLDTINHRLEVLGPDRNYEVNVPDEIKLTVVPRRFLSDTWGGNTQNTFPKIRREMLLKHGLDDWQYPNSLYNPHCPQIPGYAGLMFSPNGLETSIGESSEIMRTIVRLMMEPKWQYVGQYIDISAPSLTKEEWLVQHSSVKNTWAKEIWRKGWGWRVRVRVTLRKRLHRNPTYGELNKAYQEPENNYQDITPDDIRAAYDRGEELLGVHILKCVGYDEAFQREVHEKFQTWVPPPPREKGAGKGKTGSKGRNTGNPRGQQRGQKRKRDEEIITESDDSEVPESEDEKDEAEDVVYVPTGTKSRPKN